jgi:heme/copper-type cytochrome/quinol oxidase subunit 1
MTGVARRLLDLVTTLWFVIARVTPAFIAQTEPLRNPDMFNPQSTAAHSIFDLSIGTMWGGKLIFKAPMLFCIGFLFQFLIAGLTGIMLAASPLDWQLGNSYFVVAHFHYVIVGGILFTIFAAFYYYFPKITGRRYSEKLAQWHFWLFLLGFHLTFDFMHIPGLLGMPRRIYTYEPGRGWEFWNLIVSLGALFQVSGSPRICLQPFVVVFQRSPRRTRPLGCLDPGMVN